MSFRFLGSLGIAMAFLFALALALLLLSCRPVLAPEPVACECVMSLDDGGVGLCDVCGVP